MCETSVDNWLKSLRYSVEYYESYEYCTCKINICSKNMEIVRNFDNTNELVYENIWDCVENNNNNKLNVKFGDINRVSVEFCDCVEELDVEPIVFQKIHVDLSDDIMLWKNNLRFECSYEEQNLLESQVQIFQRINNNFK